jgi:hypothetical protein
MGPRRTHAMAWPRIAAPHVAALALLLIMLVLAAPLAYAQATAAVTPGATAAATAAATGTGATGTAAAGTAAVTPGTPTRTPTPTLTPTATPTLTELAANLALANTYLAGRNYDKAVELFSQIAQDTRGNPDALKGLQAALDGQRADLATAMAPPPAEPTPAPTAPPAPPTLRETLAAKLAEYGGIALAGLLVVIAVYLIANAIRLLLYGLRELWYLRLLPLLKRPAVEPGFLIAEFSNNLGAAGENAARIVPYALTEKLLLWNQLIQARELPVEPEPALDLGGMGWLKVLWRWFLPAPRGYRVTGALLPGNRGAFRLAVQRTNLARNSVDRSAAFEQAGPSAEAVFRDLAGEAAKWLVKPQDMEGAAASMRAVRAVRGEGDILSPSEIFDQALALLLPVRQQVNQGAIDFADARVRLRDASALLNDLPSESPLRQDLERVIADLRTAVPGE